ncbi:MAG: hypothetical protein HY519_01465, partial [Candidatus Aenigmarchaeota archaeon]|nr:hypothetical protein [Candidatus Aenigmarchaeota archaeon]
TNPLYEFNQAVFRSVLSKNGYDDANMYVLYGTGNAAADGNRHKTDGPASPESIGKLIEHLESMVSQRSRVFIYVTGHGHYGYFPDPAAGKITRMSTISLAGGSRISEAEWAKQLLKIYPNQGILLYDQCKSGGFARRTGKHEWAAVSACDVDEDSTSNSFTLPFLRGWDDRLPEVDGRMSLRALFDHAVAHDEYAIKGQQHPQLFSQSDPDSIDL